MKKYLFLLVIIVSALACTQKDSEEPQVMSVARYVELLKSNQYKAMELPAFNHAQIGELIQYVGEEEIIKSAPANPISSMNVSEIRLGIYVAWTIESIRKVAIENVEPFGRFPSLVPGLRMKDPDAFLPVSDDQSHLIIAKAYKNWWEENKSKPFDDFMNIDPLENTPYTWH